MARCSETAPRPDPARQQDESRGRFHSRAYRRPGVEDSGPPGVLGGADHATECCWNRSRARVRERFRFDLVSGVGGCPGEGAFDTRYTGSLQGSSMTLTSVRTIGRDRSVIAGSDQADGCAVKAKRSWRIPSPVRIEAGL